MRLHSFLVVPLLCSACFLQVAHVVPSNDDSYITMSRKWVLGVPGKLKVGECVSEGGAFKCQTVSDGPALRKSLHSRGLVKPLIPTKRDPGSPFTAPSSSLNMEGIRLHRRPYAVVAEAYRLREDLNVGLVQRRVDREAVERLFYARVNAQAAADELLFAIVEWNWTVVEAVDALLKPPVRDE